MIYRISAENITEGITTIDLPASKSLSNRALILKALCTDECQLHHLSDCDDTRVMLAAFDNQPTESDAESGTRRIVDIGAAGTSMRFLTAYFASQPGQQVTMTGSARMKQRPISVLVNALRELGADIEYAEQEGFPPLNINGKKLDGGALSIDGSTSSQYISALLMIAPTLTNGLNLTLTGSVTSRPYIDMTLQMMHEFGVEGHWTSDNSISVEPQQYKAKSYTVESDWSAASYWYEICLFRYSQTGYERNFNLKGLKSNSLQGDSKIALYFAELGVDTSFTSEGANIRFNTERKTKDSVEWDLSSQPDLAQTLIVSCCGTQTHFDIRGLHTLRIKETDRISALENELSKYGVDVHVDGDDRMTWNGETTNGDGWPTFFDTYEDHRMAMAFAPLALDCEIFVCDPMVVTKSYPSFWDDMRLAEFNIEELNCSKEEALKNLESQIKHNKRTLRIAKLILNTLLLVVFLLIGWFLYWLISR